MHTKDMLAEALREIGLTQMADKATTGWYHDFLSPLDLPEMQLANDLAMAARDNESRRAEILKLRGRVIDGDFDASTEETAWAASPEGQDAMRHLFRR
jgi:hypothetical protein